MWPRGAFRTPAMSIGSRLREKGAAMRNSRRSAKSGLAVFKRPAALKVGLVPADDRARELTAFAEVLCREELERNFPGLRWTVERVEAADGQEAVSVIQFLEMAHRTLARRDLDFAFVVTSHAPGSRVKVCGDLVSRSLASGIIPLDELGLTTGIPEDGEQIAHARRRFVNLLLHLLGLLIGLPETDDTAGVMGAVDPADPAGIEGSRLLGFTDAERALAGSRLAKLVPGQVEKAFKEMRLAWFYLWVTARYPFRIAQTALTNRPWRLVTSLHKLVFPALVTVPIALLSVELWQLGVNMNTRRLVLICAAVVFGATVFIVVKQKLLMRMPRGGRSENVVIFNTSSVLSILAAVSLLFAVIFLGTLLISGGIFPREVLKNWLSVDVIGLGDYARVSLLIASLASIVGWLGAGFTESDQFRLMLYTSGDSR